MWRKLTRKFNDNHDCQSSLFCKSEPETTWESNVPQCWKKNKSVTSAQITRDMVCTELAKRNNFTHLVISQKTPWLISISEQLFKGSVYLVFFTPFHKEEAKKFLLETFSAELRHDCQEDEWSEFSIAFLSKFMNSGMVRTNERPRACQQ